MKISELAKRTGVSTHALRHYERLGLLEPVRHANGYRDHTEAMRREVVFIAMSRKIGFSLAALAALRAQVISHMKLLQKPLLKKTAASATSHPSRKRSKK